MCRLLILMLLKFDESSLVAVALLKNYHGSFNLYVTHYSSSWNQSSSKEVKKDILFSLDVISFYSTVNNDAAIDTLRMYLEKKREKSWWVHRHHQHFRHSKEPSIRCEIERPGKDGFLPFLNTKVKMSDCIRTWYMSQLKQTSTIFTSTFSNSILLQEAAGSFKVIAWRNGYNPQYPNQVRFKPN